jgi:flagellar basal-body rod modification protein FlgD
MILQGLTDPVAAPGGQAAKDKQQVDEDLFKFLNLLVTQLQAQDPLDPMDANEFTQQLVQFASVEQQIYQNAHLENLLKVQQNAQVAAMVNYLGTLAEVKGNALPLAGGHADAGYTLPENAEETTLTIRDGKGKVVFSAPGEITAGVHAFAWDGHDAAGDRLADGSYSLEVSARRADGTALQVEQTTLARVTGAALAEGKVVLSFGDLDVPLEDVLSIREARPATHGEGD